VPLSLNKQHEISNIATDNKLLSKEKNDDKMSSSAKETKSRKGVDITNHPVVEKLKEMLI
jgi:hypothetical protein